MSIDIAHEKNANTPDSFQTQLLQMLPQVIVVVGKNREILYANASAEQYFNASCNVLQRMSLSDLFHFDSPVLTLVEKVHEGHKGYSEYDVEIGSIRHTNSELMDLQITPFDPGEEAVIVVLQPRSMARKIERQLAHQGAARSVTGLAAMLAHEIRNPLSGIRGAAQLLDGIVAPEDRALTHLICEETDRISRLVGRMEVFGDNRFNNFETLNIHSVLGHVLKLAQSGFAADLELIENYDPSLPDLSGNKDLLIQLFLNLVKNASEAVSTNQRKGRIWITTSFRPGVSFKVPGSGTRSSLPLQITIEDNGPGIPDDLMSCLFDPFVTSKANGSGLGLALVAKIVRDHGGTIEAQRESERTIFKVLLPPVSSERESS